MTLISVIIPTYNRADLLVNRALPSVFAQTMWPEQEVLVVGDGTDQATVDAIKEQQRHHSELRFWNLPHYPYPDNHDIAWGLYGLEALNFGIDHARGEWIAVLGDDDEFTPDHHEVLLNAREPDVDHIYGLSMAYSGGLASGQTYGSWPPGDAALANGANLWRRSLGYRFALDCWDRGHAGDADMWIRMFADGVKFQYTPQLVHKYHRNWPP